jgi:sugar phosphate isomerase/epimerase
MKRKPILSLFCAGFMIVFISASCGSRIAQKKNIGLQLYSLRDSMATNMKGAIQFSANTGYSFVELAGYDAGKFYGLSPLTMKDMVESTGMKIISSHASLVLPGSNEWEAALAWWDTCIAAHKQAGIQYIVQTYMDSVGYLSLQGLQNYCDYFNLIGKKCRENGLKFGYHNHTSEFGTLEGQRILDYMLQHTDSSKVFFQLDLYWTVTGGANPIDYFRKYPGRFELWHVKDSLELGSSGKMDFKAMFDLSEMAGMKHYIVEQELFTNSPFEGIQESFRYLNDAEYVKN